MAMKIKDGRRYMYIAHEHGPAAFSIFDVTEPSEPKMLWQLPLPHRRVRGNSLAMRGDILLLAYQAYDRGGKPAGFQVYDISKPAEPREITFYDLSGADNHSVGVHYVSFMDGRYAHLCASHPDFEPNHKDDNQFYMIVDLANPSKPTEVGRWAMENQHVEGGDTPHPKGAEHRLHHAMRLGNQMFAGCWMSGVSIIDVSDITRPKTLSRHEYSPPHPEPTHTFLGVPHSIGGRRIAVSTEEERPNRGPDHGKPHAPLRTWDVTDPTNPKILCTYELPDSATPYDTNVCRFGTHQLR
jgi:hypothetical protein